MNVVESRCRLMGFVPPRISSALFAVWLCQAAPASAQNSVSPNPFPRFSDVAAQVGLTPGGGHRPDTILETNGNGAGFFDYDNDGDLDVAIAHGSDVRDLMINLYENNEGRFSDVTSEALLTTRGWAMGLCVADYDDDGDPDVYLTAWGPNVMYRNNGDGTFTDVTTAAGVGDTGWGMNCAFADYDRDGDVDLYVANYLTFDESVPRRGETPDCRYMAMDVFCGPRGLQGEPDTLYRNEGDGTFTDVSESAGITDPGYYGFGVAFTDFDGDGWPDIYVANDSVPNLMFHNNADGTFLENGLLSGTSLNGAGKEQAGMGLSTDDFDGDGDLDIFVTNFSQDTNTLYQNLGNLLFYDATQKLGLGEGSFAHLGWGTGFADLDNDGWSDIFVANGHVYPDIDDLNVNQTYRQPKEIYRSIAGQRFVLVPADSAGDVGTPHSARGLAFGDYDNDGDVDALAVNIDSGPSLYRNEGGNRNAWITFRLEGGPANRSALGARVEIEAGGRTRVREVQSGGSYLSQNALRVHFGLGSATTIDASRVYWPDGTTEDLGRLETRRFVVVRQGEGVIESRP